MGERALGLKTAPALKLVLNPALKRALNPGKPTNAVPFIQGGGKLHERLAALRFTPHSRIP
ncbi:hypothetical protein ARTHRO8AJ_60151 [Arthrobacter sp. 8AJ]|nr:hypothetical protein ARTHRO8AJ_60151 [Arthrobacter sp. 8AJ]